jgi:hypothetical protein
VKVLLAVCNMSSRMGVNLRVSEMDPVLVGVHPGVHLYGVTH